MSVEFGSSQRIDGDKVRGAGFGRTTPDVQESQLNPVPFALRQVDVRVSALRECLDIYKQKAPKLEELLNEGNNFCGGVEEGYGARSVLQTSPR